MNIHTAAFFSMSIRCTNNFLL